MGWGIAGVSKRKGCEVIKNQNISNSNNKKGKILTPQNVMPGNPPHLEENKNQYLPLNPAPALQRGEQQTGRPIPKLNQDHVHRAGSHTVSGTWDSSSTDGNRVPQLILLAGEQWSAGILVSEVGPAEHGNTGGFRMLHPVLSPNLTSSRLCSLSWASSVLCILRHQLDTIENHTAASESSNSAR